MSYTAIQMEYNLWHRN